MSYHIISYRFISFHLSDVVWASSRGVMQPIQTPGASQGEFENGLGSLCQSVVAWINCSRLCLAVVTVHVCFWLGHRYAEPIAYFLGGEFVDITSFDGMVMTAGSVSQMDIHTHGQGAVIAASGTFFFQAVT